MVKSRFHNTVSAPAMVSLYPAPSVSSSAALRQAVEISVGSLNQWSIGSCTIAARSEIPNDSFYAGLGDPVHGSQIVCAAVYSGAI